MGRHQQAAILLVVLRVKGSPMPRSVLAFAIFTLTLYAVRLPGDHGLWRHPAGAAVIVAVSLLWLAGIVLWRALWTWWLWLVAELVGLVGPLWKHESVTNYVIGVVLLAFLVSPGMRSWVGYREPRFLAAARARFGR